MLTALLFYTISPPPPPLKQNKIQKCAAINEAFFKLTISTLLSYFSTFSAVCQLYINNIMVQISHHVSVIATTQEIFDSTVVAKISVDGLKPVDCGSDLCSFRQWQDQLRRCERRGLVVLVQDPDLQLSFTHERGRGSTVGCNHSKDVSKKNNFSPL